MFSLCFRAISTVRLTLFFPIFPWIFQMVILILGIACFMYLTTIGDMLFAVKGQVNNAGSDCVCKPELNYKDGSACTVADFTAGCHSKSNLDQPCSDAVCHYRGVLGGSNAKILHGKSKPLFRIPYLQIWKRCRVSVNTVGLCFKLKFISNAQFRKPL